VKRQIPDNGDARKLRRERPMDEAGRRGGKRAHPRCKSLCLIGLAAVLPGCTSPTTNYGIGNDLLGRTRPLGPGVTVSDAQVIPPGILDAGCDGAACLVSWTADIFPNMESSGAWQCASTSCHGGGATPPSINDGDPAGAYASLATFAGIDPAYIVPCNTSASACSILCNLTPNGCGMVMPIGTGTPLTTAQLSAIQTWIACGSPFN
jgi:hypothetical protein